ncbi:MAG: type I glyceraldehyde-3-phosphate dehydrogenase, partial [Persicimonas sp.]
MATRVAINGFGRIGRQSFRHLMNADDLELVAINDVGDPENLAYLMRHDSAYPAPTVEVRAAEGKFHWGERAFPFLNVHSPAELPWSDMGVELVLEASGVFTDADDASKHLDAGAERVIVSAPSKGADVTICLGCNEDTFDPDEHTVVSNASCTTNALAPVAKVLDDQFGIATGYLTTVHAATSSQKIVDLPHKKWRRGRSVMSNIVPTTTGAAVSVCDMLCSFVVALQLKALQQCHGVRTDPTEDPPCHGRRSSPNLPRDAHRVGAACWQPPKATAGATARVFPKMDSQTTSAPMTVHLPTSGATSAIVTCADHHHPGPSDPGRRVLGPARTAALAGEQGRLGRRRSLRQMSAEEVHDPP